MVVIACFEGIYGDAPVNNDAPRHVGQLSASARRVMPTRAETPGRQAEPGSIFIWEIIGGSAALILVKS